MRLVQLFLSMVLVSLIFFPSHVLGYSTRIGYYGAMWDHDPLRIGVYVDPNFLHNMDMYEKIITDAFDKWARAIRGTGNIPDALNVFIFEIRFHDDLTFLDDNDVYVGVIEEVPDSADITLAGITRLYVSEDGKITTGIILLEADLEENLYSIALHQIGHSLGLTHTFNENHRSYTDIMIEENDSASAFTDPSRISSLDTNALLFLYSKDGFGSFNRDSVPLSYKLKFGN